jgi:hypothetical protein
MFARLSIAAVVFFIEAIIVAEKRWSGIDNDATRWQSARYNDLSFTHTGVLDGSFV